MKTRLLGVPSRVVSQWGAVSAQTAAAMAQGVRHAFGTTVGLSLTGIAGPTGGTSQKPVGLVYLGLSNRRGIKTQRYQFFGDRLSIKTQAAQAGLDWLRRYLINMARAETKYEMGGS